MKALFGLALAACAAPGIATADDGAPVLALRAKAPGTFEVVYHRIEPTGAGGAVGGLLGAAIQGGIQSSNDDAKTKKILPLLTDANCGQPVLDAMALVLREDGKRTVAFDSTQEKPSAVVTIHECSLRLVDSGASQLAAFVNFTLDYIGTDATWSEKITITGRAHQDFGIFSSKPGLAQAELSETLKRAGVRAANKIIYRK